MIWFTSDTHFGHENIIKLCERPWSDAASMERDLVATINACVGKNDTLYHLGDFSFKIGIDDQERILRRINCKDIHIIPGNHDKHLPEIAAHKLIKLEPPILEIKQDGRRITLSHYPIADWAGMRQGALHLHGHIHSRGLDYNEACRSRGLLRYDVGMDANGYAPVSLSQVMAFFNGVQPNGRMTWDEWMGFDAKPAKEPRFAFIKNIF